MIDAPELLPCPFCGGKPEGPIDATKVLGTWRIIHRGCVIPNFSVDRSQKESAITAWNTRAHDPHDPRVAALVDAANRVDDEYCAQIYGSTIFAMDDLRAALAAFKGGGNGRQTP